MARVWLLRIYPLEETYHGRTLGESKKRKGPNLEIADPSFDLDLRYARVDILFQLLLGCSTETGPS